MQSLKPFVPNERFKINVLVERGPYGLDVHFSIIGHSPADMAKLKLAPLLEESVRRRRDNLWATTCLEIFYASPGKPDYVEVNVSPSGDWNTYAFDDYRSGMRPHETATLQIIATDHATNADRVGWHFRLRDELPSGLVVGATAVLEYVDGSRDYWALAHAGTKPDFHLRDSFRLSI